MSESSLSGAGVGPSAPGTGAGNFRARLRPPVGCAACANPRGSPVCGRELVRKWTRRWLTLPSDSNFLTLTTTFLGFFPGPRTLFIGRSAPVCSSGVAEALILLEPGGNAPTPSSSEDLFRSFARSFFFACVLAQTLPSTTSAVSSRALIDCCRRFFGKPARAVGCAAREARGKKGMKPEGRPCGPPCTTMDARLRSGPECTTMDARLRSGPECTTMDARPRPGPVCTTMDARLRWGLLCTTMDARLIITSTMVCTTTDARLSVAGLRAAPFGRLCP